MKNLAGVLTLFLLALPTVAAETDAATPQSASTDWLSTVRKKIAEQEYHVTWQERTCLAGLDAAWQAPNRAHNLRTHFTPEGIRVVRRTETDPSWEWGLSLYRVGRPWSMAEVGSARLSAFENRVDYERPGELEILEWYVNDPKGLEQGFTIPHRPGSPGDRIFLDLQLTGSLLPVLAEDRQSFDFQTSDGRRLIHYGHLKVVDAAGRTLESWMEGFSGEGVGGVRLVIEDGDAVYPLYVDPLATSPAWTASGVQTEERFGFSAASAGDMNADGFGDVVVGAPYYDEGGTDNGAIFVYYGSASGLAPDYGWYAGGNGSGDWLGWSVSAAGDIDGDGYSDIVVGEPGDDIYYPTTVANAGGFYIFFGSETTDEIGTNSFINPNSEENQYAGESVSSAGDVNGDGYSDVIVGGHGYGWPLSTYGCAYVYHGSPSGDLSEAWSHCPGVDFGRAVGLAGDVNGDGYSDVIVGWPDQPTISQAFVWHGSAAGLSPPASPDWTFDYPSDSGYGRAVSTAGDVNGDGYSDVVVGAPDFGGEDQLRGRALLYLGSAAGLGATESWSVTETQYFAQLGRSVATAGDVNGDGYSDVVIGTPYFDNGEEDEGRADVYLGSSGGLESTPVWTVESDKVGAYFGRSVFTAGDVNGDGYSDLIVGASEENVNHHDDTGKAYLYHGSPSGLEDPAHWRKEINQSYAYYATSLAGAGDVDGDGYDDLIVGAPHYDGGEPNEGKIFIYRGTTAGLDNSPFWSAESNQAGSFYGKSVASAGDVNGDGYSDVLVGAPNWDAGETDEGRVFYYVGTPSKMAYRWSAQADQPYANMGEALAAGDINGDGHSDVILGAPSYDNGQSDEGMVFAWFGSSGNLGENGTPLNADWSAQSNQASAEFGESIAAEGDVNGDGYNDVIVGAPGWDGGETDEGSVFAWYGSPLGPEPGGTPANADWQVEWNQAGAGMGESVSWAGDVDNDGYSDVIVGAPFYDQTSSGYTDAGRAGVYHGSMAGPGATANWTKTCSETGARCGHAVAGVGDVNGDGCSEIAFGAFGHDHDHADEGAVYVYNGTPSGVNLLPSATRRGGQANAHFGKAVAAAGDVNGDGYADLAVGAPNFNGGLAYEGRAYVFLGNEGRTRHVRPRQRTIPGDPIARLGRSDDPSAVSLSLLSRGLLGRGKVQLESEISRRGELLDGSGTSWSGSWVNSGLNGITVSDSVFGLSTNDLHHWRVRVRQHPTTSPYQQWGRWISRPWGGINEGRFRLWLDDDGDGIDNRQDNCPGMSNPAQDDLDDDGVGDPCDNCQADPNPGQQDGDSDGTGDACDTCTDPDSDGYGMGYAAETCPTDNCPDDSNPGQEDADADATGDVCDSCTDIDNDGFGDPGYPANTCTEDNCPSTSNPGQEDGDSDGDGDACDTCTDPDSDGYGMGYAAETCPADNCPDDSNPGQEDADGDDTGDVCDTCTDTDGDGYGNPGYPANTCTEDNCPDDSNPGQENYDGDGMGDACDPDDDDDGWEDFSDCLPLDETNWSAPSDPHDLYMSKAATDNLTWSAPTEPGTSGVLYYDLLLSTSPAGWGYDVTDCVESDDTDLVATETSEPLPGNAYHYLVRSQNSCGENMGEESDGTPRSGRACP